MGIDNKTPAKRTGVMEGAYRQLKYKVALYARSLAMVL
jgi:hypothetical protein